MRFRALVLAGAFTLSSAVGQIFTYDADGVLQHVDYGETNRVKFAFDQGANLISVTGPSQIESWRFQKFGTLDPVGAASDNAAPAGDGVANLVKYALGLEPNYSASPRDLGELVKTVDGYQFLYRIRGGNDEFVVRVQRSRNMSQWSTDLAPLELVATNGFREFLSAFPNDAGSNQFFRLLIHYKPSDQ